MNWYYADAGKQAGPVNDAQLDALIAAGRVTPDTLVWHDQLANWQPLRAVRPAVAASAQTTLAPPVAAPGTGTVTCAECGGTFTRDNAIQYGTAWVCAACKPVFVQKLREGVSPAGVAANVRYAGFWIRFVAKFVDGLIFAVIIGIPVVLLLVTTGAFNPPGGGQTANLMAIWVQIIIQLGSIFIAVAYNTFFIGRYAATPGKMAVGLRVIRPDGSAPTYMRAFGRAWADQLSGMICYIGYIIAAFDGQKRALHDHMCDTRVIYK
jgi:uncharacterized RDD family membrane protein YckC